MTDKDVRQSESANDVQEIKDMILQLRKDVGYLYGLVETVVERITLENKSKNDLKDIMKLNSRFIEGIIQGRDFDGKDQLKNVMDKLDRMGETQ